MHADFQRLLHEATILTRRGDLQAATAAIQQALSQRDQPAGDENVIDVSAREVPEDLYAPALPGPNGLRRSPDAPAGDGIRTPMPEPTVAVPTQSAFVSGRYGGTGLAGRDYKLFIPAGAGSRPMPLVVMLHGCTQDPDDFAAGTRMNELAQSEGFFVLYPAQSQRANPQRCWNWFKPRHQARGRGEPDLLAGMVRAVITQHAIDPNRIYVAGLSAGGAMAAILAAAYPDLFAAVGVHSGLAPGAAHDVPSAFDAMKKGAARSPRGVAVPTIVFHGDRDATVHPVNGQQVIDAARTADSIQGESEERRAAGGRKATRRVYRDAAGSVVLEHWLVHGAPHAWSGGSGRGSYTDPEGPDATAEMLRFFLEHSGKAR